MSAKGSSRVVTALASVSGAVSSVFGRTGAVSATTGDYTVAQVTGAAPLASPTFTGVVKMNGGSNTATAATASTPTPSTGVAFTPSAAEDCELSFAVSTAATFTVTMGPTTGAENTVLSSTALGIGTFFNKRIPAGWKVIITGTIADLENILAVTC